MLVAIYLASFVMQALLFLNWDAASLLYASKVLLAGGKYVTDIFTPNPPMILYLYAPVVLVSEIFKLNVVMVFQLYVYLLCSISLAACSYCVNSYFKDKQSDLSSLFIAVLAVGYLILPIFEFGDRDHLLIVLTMPYLLMAANRVEGKRFNVIFAIGVGIAAGVGFAIKPHYLITLALLEIYLRFAQNDHHARQDNNPPQNNNLRRGNNLLRIETIVVALILAAYAALMMVIYPEFTQVIVPFLLRNYYSAIGASLWTLTTHTFTIFSLMTLALYCLMYTSLRKNHLMTILALALTGSICAIYLQHTLFYYHFLPALTIAMLMCACLFSLMMRQKVITITHAKIAILTAAFLIIDINLYYQTWTYAIFYPWYFYGFFAALFAFLFYLEGIHSLLSTFSKTSFIVVSGACCASVLLSLGYFDYQFAVVISVMLLLYATLSRHLITAILALTMFYVPVMQEHGNFQAQREYKMGPFSKLINFVNSQQNTQSIYFMSPAIYFTYPLVYYTHTLPAQRFDQLWPVLAFTKTLNNTQKQDKQFFISMVTEDLKNNKPDLIFLDTVNANPKKFNYVDFFSENADFRKEWQQYRYLTTLKLGMINAIDAEIPVYQRIKSKDAL